MSIRLAKEEKVTKVYINGLRQIEKEDYTVKKSRLILKPTVEKGSFLTIETKREIKI